MNILYIDHYAGSPQMGMEFRPYYLSKEWIKQGHKVFVIAGDYSHLRTKNPKVKKDFQVNNIDGIKYVWIKTGRYEGNGVARALSMERFVRKLLRYAKIVADKVRPDVVISSSTYPLDTYPAQRIAHQANCKYIHEVHDMWPSTLYEVGGMSRLHPFVIVMQLAENSAYKHCDKCVSLLPYSKEYMINHGLGADKFVNIQNGVAPEEWENPEHLPKEHIEFFDNKRGKFIVGYFGGHAISNALDWMLDVAKEMQKKQDICFVLVGKGVEKERLMKRKIDENINNVYFLDSVSKNAVPELLKHFDCSYMTGMPSPLERFGMSLNKMYDSMMAGMPIICAFDAPSTLVREYECGYQCNPANMEEVIEAIENIYSMDKIERDYMGNRGKQAILENYTYSRLAIRFMEIFQEGSK